MTYNIKLTPFTAALMDGAARAAGCSVEALLAGTICGWQGTRPERREPTRRADQPTPEQAAELARQLAAASPPAGQADAAAAPIRLPGYDPTFTPDPENFGQLN